MATQARPRAFESAVTGWRLTFAAFVEMPAVFGWAMLASLVLNAAALPLLTDESETSSFGVDLLSFGLGIVQGFVLTPVAIAVHRYVLLGETMSRYALEPSNARFMRFFLFSIVFQALTVVPSLLFTVTSRLGGFTATLFGVGVAALIAGAIISLRMLVLFPAIAVDAPGAGWRNAMQDSRGYSWTTFGMMLLTLLPLLAVELPLYFFFMWPLASRSLVGTIVFVVAESVFTVLSIAACAAVASLLYRALAQRLHGPHL